MTFSLLDSPFVALSADSTMSAEALAERAGRDGTARAAAALHTLSAPRTRLAAELAFLPGAADRSSAIVDHLRRGERPELADLPDQARANVVAHLCDAGLDEDGDLEALVTAQVERGDPAFIGAVAVDRRAADFPAPDPAMLAAAQDDLADRHAAALVRACARRPDAAHRLAGLMRREDWPRPSTARAILRRAAVVWSRETAGAAAEADEAVGRAEATLSRTPSAAAAGTFIAALRAWAELTAPERLVDAAAGLDHEPSSVKARRWRGLTQRLAQAGLEGPAAEVASALVETLGELPGFANLLRRDRDGLATAARDQAQVAAFEPLAELTRRLGAAPAGLIDALLAAGFGAGSSGPAGELWAAFAHARSAAPDSERPYVLLDELAGRLDSAPAALALLQGVAAAAVAAGANETAGRLRAHERVLRRQVGLARLRGLTGRWRTTGAALKEIALLLPLADDPALRNQLAATQQRLQRRRATFTASACVGIGVIALAAIGIGRSVLVGSHDTPTASASSTALSTPAGASATTGGFIMPKTPPIQEMSPYKPLPAAQPQAGVGPAPAPEAPAVSVDGSGPGTPLVVHFDPTTPSESRPDGSTDVYPLTQVRWCLFNAVRLAVVKASLAGQDEARKDAFNHVAGPWNDLCTRYPAARSVTAQGERETRTYHGALMLQAQQIEHEIESAAP